jgi:mRNA-degrading endonuclease toxin of MazEF toxin-antitoxin module
VWFADLGLVGKGRPVLVLYYPEAGDARSLTIVAPLTSQVRGLRGEVDLGHPKWLPKPSAVNVQGLASIDRHKLTRRWGKLAPEQMAAVKSTIMELLQLGD